jgi:signal transduction histidine kinase
MIAAQNPDILLLDHKLPGISGLDVLEKVAGKINDCLTIVITAYASLEVAITATKRGAYDFLAKPFTPDELKDAVRKAARHLAITRQACRLAEEKRQVRFQFISVLAHELKAPISSIEGYLQIVRERSAGDDQAVYDNMLSRSVVRLGGMRKLIDDLLDLTHIESGQKKRDLSEMDISDVAGESIEAFVPVAAEKDVTIELHCPDSLKMTADRGEIEIVLNNLISNAVKYNRPGGRVDVTLTGDDDTVTIAVADTGIGMTAEETDRLFGEFVRIKNAQTRNILGSGLGLSIVKKLALLYDGDAAATSEQGVGSTFRVTLKRNTRNSTQE